MLQRAAADLRVVVTKRSPLVALVLKKIRVDRADLHALPASQPRDRFWVLAWFEVPEHVHRNGWAAARERMDLSRIGELVTEIDRGGILEKFPEARPRVGKSPGGRLNG